MEIARKNGRPADNIRERRDSNSEEVFLACKICDMEYKNRDDVIEHIVVTHENWNDNTLTSSNSREIAKKKTDNTLCDVCR